MKTLAGIAAGVAVGVLAGIFVFGPGESKERSGERVSADPRLKELEAENKALKARLETMREQAQKQLEEFERLHTPPDDSDHTDHDEAEPEPAATAPPTEEELRKTVRKFAGKLQSIWFGGGKEEVAELRALIKRGGKPLVDKLVSEYQDETKGAQELVVLAHVLGQSGEPDAIEGLKSVLRDPDRGEFHHRFAAHALAFSPAEGLEPFLEEVARNDKDLGARANAAFGLAKRDVDAGYDLYAKHTDEAFESGDPAAIAYLSGFSIMGEKALPAVRERLLKYKDPQAVLSLIQIAKGAKDKGSLEALNKLAFDANQPVSIQNAAKGAIKEIEAVETGDDEG